MGKYGDHWSPKDTTKDGSKVEGSGTCSFPGVVMDVGSTGISVTAFTGEKGPLNSKHVFGVGEPISDLFWSSKKIPGTSAADLSTAVDGNALEGRLSKTDLRKNLRQATEAIRKRCGDSALLPNTPREGEV